VAPTYTATCRSSCLSAADPQSNRKLRLTNPATEQQFFEAAEAGEGDLQAAVTAARRAFDKGPWPRTSPAKRARKMRDLADALVRRSRSLERAWISQIATPVSMRYRR
jgi:aldehyde dehydrogenase (NAD+)